MKTPSTHHTESAKPLLHAVAAQASSKTRARPKPQRSSLGKRSAMWVPEVVLSTEANEKRGAQIAALVNRVKALLAVTDAQRANDIIQAHIAAAIPLQAGAREQAELVGEKIRQTLAHIPMLTSREVAMQTRSTAARPETLTAQWLSRRQIFGVELAGLGLRFAAFQFQPSGQPWPALKQALPALLKAFSPLHLLLWFDSPLPVLGDKMPREVLHDPQALMLAVQDSTTPIDIY